MDVSTRLFIPWTLHELYYRGIVDDPNLFTSLFDRVQFINSRRSFFLVNIKKASRQDTERSIQTIKMFYNFLEYPIYEEVITDEAIIPRYRHFDKLYSNQVDDAYESNYLAIVVPKSQKLLMVLRELKVLQDYKYLEVPISFLRPEPNIRNAANLIRVIINDEDEIKNFYKKMRLAPGKRYERLNKLIKNIIKKINKINMKEKLSELLTFKLSSGDPWFEIDRNLLLNATISYKRTTTTDNNTFIPNSYRELRNAVIWGSYDESSLIFIPKEIKFKKLILRILYCKSEASEYAKSFLKFMEWKIHKITSSKLKIDDSSGIVNICELSPNSLEAFKLWIESEDSNNNINIAIFLSPYNINEKLYSEFYVYTSKKGIYGKYVRQKTWEECNRKKYCSNIIHAIVLDLLSKMGVRRILLNPPKQLDNYQVLGADNTLLPFASGIRYSLIVTMIDPYGKKVNYMNYNQQLNTSEDELFVSTLKDALYKNNNLVLINRAYIPRRLLEEASKILDDQNIYVAVSKYALPTRLIKKVNNTYVEPDPFVYIELYRKRLHGYNEHTYIATTTELKQNIGTLRPVKVTIAYREGLGVEPKEIMDYVLSMAPFQASTLGSLPSIPWPLRRADELCKKVHRIMKYSHLIASQEMLPYL